VSRRGGGGCLAAALTVCAFLFFAGPLGWIAASFILGLAFLIDPPDGI
jgi:hypothetical protein